MPNGSVGYASHTAKFRKWYAEICIPYGDAFASPAGAGVARRPGWPPRIGIERMRTPVAAKTALAMAGAIAIMGVSPPPAEGMSVLLIR